ncbi:MAG TPA: ABC transporter ATP-binding protein, partial [Planococcus sp. (in: firmicutes)]|nr:ABC transporter ATP-binding protein [Planococcus sp. (in: firmicutes)]
DPALREEMRELLRKIQQQFRVTVLFVTHDREEAFHLSDRIGVMSNGALLQVGRAKELYERPASTKVALFLGLKNTMEGTVADGRFVSEDPWFESAVQESVGSGNRFMILRPEALELDMENTGAQQGTIRINGLLQELRFNDGFYTGKVQAGSQLLECMMSIRQAQTLAIGQRIQLIVDTRDIWLVEE